LIIRRKIYGEEHSDVAPSYNNLGVICRDTGHYNEAKEFHEKALIIGRKIYGEEHRDVAASYNNLGVVCLDTGPFSSKSSIFFKFTD